MGPLCTISEVTRPTSPHCIPTNFDHSCIKITSDVLHNARTFEKKKKAKPSTSGLDSPWSYFPIPTYINLAADGFRAMSEALEKSTKWSSDNTINYLGFNILFFPSPCTYARIRTRRRNFCTNRFRRESIYFWESRLFERITAWRRRPKVDNILTREDENCSRDGRGAPTFFRALFTWPTVRLSLHLLYV